MATFKCLFNSGLVVFMLAAIVEARDPTAYVINATGETVSKINLETGVVTNDIVTIGSDILCYPNQIVVRDTLAYVIASGTDEIQIIDLNSETTVDFISLEPWSNPYWMVFLDDRFAYVTNWVTGTVAKVDVINRTVVDEEPVGLSPEGVIIRDFKLYIAITAFDQQTYQFGQGQVVVFDTWGDTVLAALNVGTNPQYLAGDTLGRIHVVCTGDYWSSFGMIYIIDPGIDAVVDSFSVGGSPGNITIGPDNTAYIAAGGWVTNGHVYNYDATSGDIYHDAANPLVVDSGCMMVVAYQDSSLFVGTFRDYVTRIDRTGNELDRFAVGDGPVHCDFNYVPGDLDGNFEVDVSDLIYLVDYMFAGGQPARYPRWRADVDGEFSVDIADLVYFVDYMFAGGQAPMMGSTWLD